MPQHAYPGTPPSQQLPRQGLKRAYSNEVSVGAGGGRGVPPPPLLPALSPVALQGYPAQQYLQGGQYAAAGAQYAPSAPQPSAPSPSYPGHRLQQGMGQYLSASGNSGPYYKVPQRGWGGGRGSAVHWCQPLGISLLPQPAEQFNGQSTGFGTYSQAAVNGVSPGTGQGGGQCWPGWALRVRGASAAGPVAAGVPQLAAGREPHTAHDAGQRHPPLRVPGSGRQVALPARHEAQRHLPAPVSLG